AGGRMAAVFAEPAAVEQSVAAFPALSIAAYNGAHVVVSGPREDVEAVVADFRAKAVRCEELETSHAFHSALLDPVLDDFERYAAELSYRPVERTLISNRTGKPAGGDALLDASYWRRQ